MHKKHIAKNEIPSISSWLRLIYLKEPQKELQKTLMNQKFKIMRCNKT